MRKKSSRKRKLRKKKKQQQRKKKQQQRKKKQQHHQNTITTRNSKHKVNCLIIAGLLLLLISTVYYLFAEKILLTSYEGPFIQIASNQPNQKLELFEIVEEDGTTILCPIWKSSEIEEVTFWIRIVDKYKYSWGCEGDIKAVDFTDRNGNYIAKEDGTTSGTGKEVIFRITLSKNVMGHFSTIKFKPKNFMTMSNNVCHVRIPWICQWFSDTSLSRLESNEKIVTDDVNILNTKINGESLYIPSIKYAASFPDISMTKKDYDLKSITPKAIPKGAYLTWTGGKSFKPSLQYDFFNDASDDMHTNILSGIIGMGLSLILEGMKERKKVT